MCAVREKEEGNDIVGARRGKQGLAIGERWGGGGRTAA
jgi:hypothetical protein